MGTAGRETHPQSAFLKDGFLTPSKAARHTQLSGVYQRACCLKTQVTAPIAWGLPVGFARLVSQLQYVSSVDQ